MCKYEILIYIICTSIVENFILWHENKSINFEKENIKPLKKSYKGNLSKLINLLINFIYIYFINFSWPPADY